MRIILIGYMGCGKTKVGKLLASKLSFGFIDADLFIEEKNGCSISDIFAREGEKGFRKIEREVLRMLLKKKNVVIASGGGTPCFFSNMELIKGKAFSIYLKVPATVLHKRLSSDWRRKNRPLLRDLSSSGLLKYIRDGLDKRELFYKQADCVFRAGKKSVKKTVSEIIPLLSLRKTV